MYDENWQELRRFPNPMEASIAAALLENEHIPCYQLNATISFIMRRRGESGLYVRACDIDQAERLLMELEKTESLSAEELAEEAMKYDAPE